MGIGPSLVRLGARLFTWNRFLREAWARRAEVGDAGPVPFAPLRRPVGSCTVALVTTAGVHRRSDVPFDMRDRRGDPSVREIPAGTPGRDLVVTHDYYDHRDADRDVNVVFPVDRLAELAAAGEIGREAPVHYSFMGHLEEPRLTEFTRGAAAATARRLAAAGVDVALLSPA